MKFSTRKHIGSRCLVFILVGSIFMATSVVSGPLKRKRVSDSRLGNGQTYPSTTGEPANRQSYASPATTGVNNCVPPTYWNTPLNIVVPSGSVLMVRVAEGVTSETAKGRPFSGSLETDIKVGQTFVAPAGSTVYGTVVESQAARRLTGRSKVELQLTGITIKNILYPIATSKYEEVGDRSGKKTVGAAGVGGLLGGARKMNESSDAKEDAAKKGAAIGMGASVFKKGESVSVSSGSLLQFSLVQPLVIQESQVQSQ
jgi:hypothetical protein